MNNMQELKAILIAKGIDTPGFFHGFDLRGEVLKQFKKAIGLTAPKAGFIPDFKIQKVSL